MRAVKIDEVDETIHDIAQKNIRSHFHLQGNKISP